MPTELNTAPITVVVAFYNASSRVEALMENLKNLKPLPAQVVLVNDGSTDDTLARLQHATEQLDNYEVITKPNGGPASARNAGIARASQPWVAFTDDDCLPDSAWLGHFVQAAEAYKDCSVFFGRIIATGDLSYLSHFVENHGGGHHTANAMYSADLLSQLSGFDEGFRVQEDTDLFLRSQAYSQHVFVPDALVHHPSRPTTLASRLRQISWYRYDYRLFDKHPEAYRRRHRDLGPTLYLLYYVGLKHTLKVLVRSFRSTRSPLALMKILASLLLERCALLVVVLHQRGRIPSKSQQ